MTVRITLLSFFLLLISAPAWSQAPKKWSSNDIHEAIKKLNFLGSALYVAAHPDDENTRLISYLSNHKKAEVAYVSLTRGDGGQNLVGPEIEELLGVIRTQELLAARRTDGGRQFFSRANDFGFSKHPDETFRIWNRDEVMSDLILAIRRWQPDVVINRFDHRSPGRTHGHHTASAMLSFEAFEMAANPAVYPEQLSMVKPWQPRRLFFNTSWWFYGSREKFEQADKSAMVNVDIGVYYAARGKSNTEIAAEASSMHKSQGFGALGRRGTEMEYMELLKGDMPGDQGDPFAGINTTWTRVEGGAPIGELMASIQQNFNFGNPAASVPDLLRACRMIKALPDGYWRNVKLAETEEVIRACLGLFAEALAQDFSATPGEATDLVMEVINRSPVSVTLKSISYLPLGIDTMVNVVLTDNKKFEFKKKLSLPADIAYSNSYWLNIPWELGMYKVSDQKLRGLPETPRILNVRFDLLVAGEALSVETPVAFKREDPVKGEVYRPFEITPPVFANLAEKVYVFADKQPQNVKVVVKSGAANINGSVSLQVPTGWKVSPAKADFSLKIKGEETTVQFSLTPPAGESDGQIVPVASVNGKNYNQEVVLINYDHIPTQTVLRESSARVVKVELKKAGNRVGYIMGAGDQIPASLRQIGYDVTILEDRDMTPEQLRKYDAIILGVRAYNTVERLKFHQPKLLEYARNGGTLIVQYNTNFDMVLPEAEIAPFPLKLSRDRVTVEEAEVRLLKPDHPVLNYPNKITDKDFQGWVQERGLYFPSEWDKSFEALLSCNDPGEPARDGGLLVAKYGQGYYIYTGYSWFRELPSGVPGAFRIFANLISIGKKGS